MQLPTGQAPLATTMPRCGVLPACSADSSVGLHAYLLIFLLKELPFPDWLKLANKLKTHSRLDACAAD